ncbi:2-hydroxychromene-2-carboxylate isomerase [Luteimonas huabeiensis]|uniref:2-hydroxychromene-2-carboxylate isomerase n=1 Tax=Luteimonas huabeiensis TaxID=1244513 RepID=UPI0004651C9E|nr:2-hydroxychromene-2-carboxylate isomerase [Luteimonas huabeiensis]
MAARWYFDFISPYSYLQWRKLREVLQARAIEPVPILLAAVLDRLGNKGPAEIPAKRAFAYRHLVWRARRDGVPLRFPPAHPFNPLPALRLAIAAGCAPDAIDAVFERIWAHGEAADSVEALAPLLARLGVPPAALADPAVKQRLHDNTAGAIAAGVFGVPTLAVGDALIWGDDAHDFAMAVLDDPHLLEDAEMRRVATLPEGVRRG